MSCRTCMSSRRSKEKQKQVLCDDSAYSSHGSYASTISAKISSIESSKKRAKDSRCLLW